MLKIISLIYFSFLGADAFACAVKNPSYVSMAISTAEEKMFSYGLKTIDEKVPGSVVSNCRETAAKKRFVMITFGPDVIGSSDVVRGTNFDKEFTSANQCTIVNSPLDKNIQTDEDLKKRFDSKWKFINKCVEVQVTELGERPLSYPKDQTGCNITSISEKTAAFNGGFCFFKPGYDSEYSVTYRISEACKKEDGYKEYGVNLQDLEASVNYYTSGTYKDEINDLSAFGNFPIRLSVNPVNSLFKASEDFGILRPTFPGNYPVNDIHLGKLAVADYGGEFLTVKVPFIVNNVCKSFEKNGLKSSICDYSTPYVGEIKIINSKGQTEASWFDGGIASTQWQGVLNGEGEKVSKELIRKNEAYKIEVSFSDPYFDFNTFKKRVKSKMPEFNTSLPPLMESGGISTIPEFEEIQEIDEMIDVGAVGDLNFPASIGNINDSRKRLGAYFSTSLYPPMYSKACSTETGICVNVGVPFVKFIATFKVNDDYSISNIVIERQSKLLGSYKKIVNEQPEYKCN